MKFVRGLVLGLSLAAVSSVRGEIEIQLVCPGSEAEGACCFSPGGPSASVNVILKDTNSETAGNPDAMLLRLIQFDLNATDPALTVGVAPGPPGQMRPGPFWDFVSTTACPSSGSVDPCLMQGYLIDGSLSGGPAGEKRLAVAFGDSSRLGPVPDNQLKATTDGVQVGRLLVTPPGEEGQWMLDLMNAKDSHPDNGAQMHFGFGTNINSEAITRWRASDSTPMITGGTIMFEVSTECEAVVCQSAVASTPINCDQALPRTANNTIRLEFAGPITAPAPGEIKILALQEGGGFDPTDLSGSFTFEVEGGNVLRIRETGQVLSNATWYGIVNDGSWTSACEFVIPYVALRGDVDNNGVTDIFDVNAIWTNRGAAPNDASIHDIDANGAIDIFDVNAAWTARGVARPGKPSGHDCPLP